MNKVFVDASVLFPAAYSETGAGRELIKYAIRGKVTLFISDLVLAETERNLAGKAPHKLEGYKALIEAVDFTVVAEPTKAEVLAAYAYTPLKDAPIVAAAIKGQVEYLVTYDKKDLLNRPEIAEKSGLKIVTPDVVVNALKEADQNADSQKQN
jgi:predicted nucleic acid-binding protein